MKKRHSAEQIVGVLRQADVLLGKGAKVSEVGKQLGISEQTYYRWRTKYGGMDPQMARQLQELQKEKARLKGWWRTKRWTIRSFERPPAQTGEPRATASDDGSGPWSLGAETSFGTTALPRT